MEHFFASMYEWFGLLPVYSHDMAEFLKGLDLACTGYLALPWYFYVGLSMLIFTTAIFGLQYDLISSKRFKKTGHWALAAFTVAAVNFAFAFIVPGVAILTHYYCAQLHLSYFDCIGFGVSNALWGVVVFAVLSLIKEMLAKTG